MRDEIARIEIEKKSRAEIDQAKVRGGPGTAAKIKEIERTREKQLLEIERQRALKEAKEQGLDPALVNELYDARQALADQKAKEDRFAEIARGPAGNSATRPSRPRPKPEVWRPIRPWPATTTRP